MDFEEFLDDNYSKNSENNDFEDNIGENATNSIPRYLYFTKI